MAKIKANEIRFFLEKEISEMRDLNIHLNLHDQARTHMEKGEFFASFDRNNYAS